MQEHSQRSLQPGYQVDGAMCTYELIERIHDIGVLQYTYVRGRGHMARGWTGRLCGVDVPCTAIGTQRSAGLSLAVVNDLLSSGLCHWQQTGIVVGAASCDWLFFQSRSQLDGTRTSPALFNPNAAEDPQSQMTSSLRHNAYPLVDWEAPGDTAGSALVCIVSAACLSCHCFHQKTCLCLYCTQGMLIVLLCVQAPPGVYCTRSMLIVPLYPPVDLLVLPAHLSRRGDVIPPAANVLLSSNLSPG
jgi:hypothetical protein